MPYYILVPYFHAHAIFSRPKFTNLLPRKVILMISNADLYEELTKLCKLIALCLPSLTCRSISFEIINILEWVYKNKWWEICVYLASRHNFLKQDISNVTSLINKNRSLNRSSLSICYLCTIQNVKKNILHLLTPHRSMTVKSQI